MTMFGERLTDFLNGQERFRVHHLECESLEDGHRAPSTACRSSGTTCSRSSPPGRAATRSSASRSQTNRLQVSIGPYLILGRLHTKPGADAVASVMQRDPMIPLTHATIAYEVAGTIVARDVATIIVNRMLVDWISPTTEAATLFPDVPVRSPFTQDDAQGLHGDDDGLAGQRRRIVPSPRASARARIASRRPRPRDPTPRCVATTRPAAGRAVPARIASPRVAVGSG